MSPRQRNSALLGLLLLAATCGDPRVRGDEMVLYYYLRGEVNSLDPALGNLEHEKAVQAQMYEALYQDHYLKRPYELQPLLAADQPTVSEDRLTYTVPVLKGVRYHDDPCFPEGKGRELVAGDFVYAWKRLADSKTNTDGSWIFADKVVGFNAWQDAASAEDVTNYDRPLEGFKALDDHTLQIRLLAPYPQLKFVMAMVYTPPLPRECVEYYGEELGNHAIGTGPFRLEKWVRGSRVVMVKNPTYREAYYPKEANEDFAKLGLLEDAGKRIPFLDRIIYKEMVEAQPRWLSFMAGELDTIKMDKDNYYTYFEEETGEVKPQYLEKGFRGWHLPLLEFYYEGFNMDDPVVGGEKNKALRQAICLVRNFDKKNRIHYMNSAIMAVSPIPPNLPEYEPPLQNPYRALKGDVEGAKRILRDAGIDPTKVPELVYTTYTGGDSRQLAENYAGEIAKLGLRMRVEVATWPEFIEKLKRRQAQLFGLVWGADYPDAQNFLQLFTCASASPGPGNMNYCNAEYDRLYNEALVMDPGPERTVIYRKLAEMIIEDCPVCPEMHRTRHYAYHERLKNFCPDETMENYLKYWRLEMNVEGDR